MCGVEPVRQLRSSCASSHVQLHRTSRDPPAPAPRCAENVARRNKAPACSDHTPPPSMWHVELQRVTLHISWILLLHQEAEPVNSGKLPEYVPATPVTTHAEPFKKGDEFAIFATCYCCASLRSNAIISSLMAPAWRGPRGSPAGHVTITKGGDFRCFAPFRERAILDGIRQRAAFACPMANLSPEPHTSTVPGTIRTWPRALCPSATAVT